MYILLFSKVSIISQSRCMVSESVSKVTVVSAASEISLEAYKNQNKASASAGAVLVAAVF
jgi:hypothetical protein